MTDGASGLTRPRWQSGVAFAAAFYLLMAVWWSVLLPALWGTDESSNTAYAVEAAAGRWPTIDTPKDPDAVLGMAARLEYDARIGAADRGVVWTANHPPLYPAVVGPIMRLGTALGGTGAGLLAGRFATALSGVVGVLATGWLAAILFPRRQHLAVLAAGVAALLPVLPHFGGQVYADVPLFALSTVALVVTTLMIRDHATDRRLLLLVAVCVALAWTKATGLVMAMLCAVAVVTVMLARRVHRHAFSRPSPTVVAVAVLGGLLALVPYLVNLARYGELSGSARLMARFDRVPLGPWYEHLVDTAFWNRLAELLVIELSEFPVDVFPAWARGLRFVFVLPAAGLVVAAYQLLRDRRPMVWSWRCSAAVLLAATGLATVVLSAEWVARGGWLHSRYLFAAGAVIAIAIAVGCDHLPGHRRAMPGVLVACGLTIANLNLFGVFLRSLEIVEDPRFGRDLPGLVAPSRTVLIAVAVTTGVALLLYLTSLVRMTIAVHEEAKGRTSQHVA